MIHQFYIVEIIPLGLKFVIWIDLILIAGKALEQINVVPSVDNLFKGLCRLM